MKEFKGANYLGSVKTSSVFREFTGSLNVEHQVTTIEVLHDKEQMILMRHLINSLIYYNL